MTDLNDNHTSKRFVLSKSHADFSSLNDLPIKWIADDDALYTLIDEIDTLDVVALDTEFIKRTTYYPILALVQVNTGQAIYLVEARKLDLTDFWQALSEVPTMVWYACGEDLGIFYLLAKCPPLTNIFDVQIGVAYLTGRLQVGYSESVQEILGISLDKGESQSDWLARPLSPAQETYAANDVRYLLALYNAVKHQLIHQQVYDYVLEDCLLYAKELYHNHHIRDEELYLDLIAPTYNRHQLAVLKALTIWRENLARAVNEPRTFIISKQALREIIEILPKNIRELSYTTINRSVIRRYGDEILAVIKQHRHLPDDKLPPLPPPTYTSKDKPFRKALDQATDEYSLAINVPSNLLLKGRWINQLIYHVYQDLPLDTLPDGLKGYRYTWIAEVVFPLLLSYKPQISAGFSCSTHAQHKQPTNKP